MLTGIRIIEVEALGPAPFAGMLLAELGAEVIVIHRKSSAQTPGKTEANLLDRGKRSIALDLKSPKDLKIAQSLIKTADGLTEGMRPGVMERLGLGPKDMHALNLRLVYGRMTGWGQTGPRAQQAGHDLNYLGLSGALFYAGLPGDVPAVPPTMLGDIGGGAMYLAVGMLAGLLKAQSTGQGCVVDAGIVDGTSHMMALLLSMREQTSITSRGQSLLDGPHWSRVYACSDDRHISVQCLEPKFYNIFLELMGLSKDLDFSQQFEQGLWPVLTKRLEALFLDQPQAHWLELFAGTDACVGPVHSPYDAQNDPHILARGIWQEGAPAAAPRFDTRGPTKPSAPPKRGQHSQDILNELTQRGLL